MLESILGMLVCIGALIGIAIVLAILVLFAVFALGLLVSGFVLLFHALDQFNRKHRRHGRKRNLPPALWGALGMQFGAWDWEHVRRLRELDHVTDVRIRSQRQVRKNVRRKAARGG